MNPIQFRQVLIQSESLILEGYPFQARLSRLPMDIWRLLVWQRPEDAQKGSWIMTIPPSQPFSLRQQAETWLLDPEGILPFVLSLKPFRWQAGPLDCLGLSSDVQGLRQEVIPPPGQRHPAQECSDGLPRGAGLSLSFDLHPEDAFYGLGERTGFLDKRGRLWKNWTTDEFFHTPLADPLYQAHPFVLLKRGAVFCGLWLDESWFSSFDLGYSDPSCWTLYTAGPTLDLYLIPGPRPEQILERYTALTGRPQLPPLWALGAHQCRWGYSDQDSVLAVAEAYRQHQLPLDALWLDIDHMQGYQVFSFSTQRFPEPVNFIAQLAEKGLKTVVIVDPGVKKTEGYGVYDRGCQIQAWICDTQDQELVGEVWPKPVVWPDFSQAQVRSWWAEEQDFYRQQGVSGLWLDMNEPSAFNWESKTLPLQARQGRHTHAELHNLYGYHMAQATWEGLRRHAPARRPFILTRAGCPGIQKFAFVWTGDNQSTWEHLEMSLPMLMNLGLSGVALTGADIGGFSGDCDGELLTRWTWLGTLYPLLRNHSAKGSRRQEPWQFGEPWLGLIRKALEFRYSLLPYLYTLVWEQVHTGHPILRPLIYAWPEDPLCTHIHDQCLLGAHLMAAPALRPGQKKRAVYLPAGTWFDYWTGQRHEGATWILMDTPLDRLPLLQRAGSALPLQPPQLHTQDAFWPNLTWQVALDSQIQGQVWQDAGEGWQPGELRTLHGFYDGQRLVLKQTPAQAATVLLLGTSPPKNSAVSFEQLPCGLRLQMQATAELEW